VEQGTKNQQGCRRRLVRSSSTAHACSVQRSRRCGYRLWQLGGSPGATARRFQIEVVVAVRCKIFGLERHFEEERGVQVDLLDHQITGLEAFGDLPCVRPGVLKDVCRNTTKQPQCETLPAPGPPRKDAMQHSSRARRYPFVASIELTDTSRIFLIRFTSASVAILMRSP
jgi:hypothetical protein